MYFSPPKNCSVTSADIDFLKSVCLVLRLFSLTIAGKKKNPEDRKRIINCHSVARLVHLFLPELAVVDGDILGIRSDNKKELYSLQATTHSWVRTPDGNIIDPYPMGIMSINSALLIPHTISPYQIHGFNQYREMPDVARQHFDEEKSWDDARFFNREIKEFIPEDKIQAEARIFDFM